MNKYILLSFAVMGFAFYEMSGGDEFVPRKAEIIAQIKAERAAEAAAREARVASRAAPKQAPVTQVRIRTAPETTEMARAKPVVQTSQAIVATQAVARSTPETAPVTLISLEQSSTQFAQPLQQLESQTWIDEETREALQQAASPSVPAVVTALPVADIRQVEARSVNMRSGPGTQYSVITSLPRGTEVEILGSNGAGWVELRTTDAQRVGWMAEYLLTDPQG